ncbi:hypothetical protein [Teredinibacter turnerae]|uniref:hypothetical protein n=1 Tax=Teredinibacter turnerae TaxID=2426 RepID=UPI000685EED5|nr:hypothetical protein [Teredinibacter turnerae]
MTTQKPRWRTKIRRKWQFAGLLAFSSGVSNTAFTDANCHALARTDLEAAYCDVRATPSGKKLPSLGDFRKNTPTMQRLILKKPAKKAGIEIPEQNADRALEQKTAGSAADKKLSIQEPNSNEARTNKSPPTPAFHPSAPPPRTGFSGIGRCSLLKNQIQCGYDYYLLRVNLQNDALTPAVFGAENRLVFPARNTGESQLEFLSRIYPQYIEKMLAIGLGDSTMSFTRFAATYDAVEDAGGDFNTRFAAMYEMLKKEKSHNAIRTRYNHNYPQNISACQFLTSTIIVCDNVTQNWIYER